MTKWLTKMKTRFITMNRMMMWSGILAGIPAVGLTLLTGRTAWLALWIVVVGASGAAGFVYEQLRGAGIAGIIKLAPHAVLGLLAGAGAGWTMKEVNARLAGEGVEAARRNVEIICQEAGRGSCQDGWTIVIGMIMVFAAVALAPMSVLLVETVRGLCEFVTRWRTARKS